MTSNIFLSLIGALIATSCAFDMDLLLEHQQRSLQTLRRVLAMRGRSAISTYEVADSDLEACFEYADRNQHDNLVNYQYETTVCGKTADDSKAKITKQNNDIRSGLLTRGGSACERMTRCESFADGLKFFDCYGQATNLGSQELQNMSLTSSDQMGVMKIQYQQIDFEQNLCKSNARNSYSKASATTNSELQKCISGEFVPPTDAPHTTPPPSTPSPSTEPPTTESITTDGPNKLLVSTELPEEEHLSSDAHDSHEQVEPH